MKKTSIFQRVQSRILSHKIISIIIVIIILGGGYYTYGKITAANASPQYVLSMARLGTISQTVTGSGQVSAENQIDVTSEVSAKIQSIAVSIGQHVVKGQLLATLDAHDASISLESARIAYAKLVQPAKTGDLTNAQNSLIKAYNDGFAAVSSTHLDLPSIMTEAGDMLYDRNGFLSDQRALQLSSSARTYRETAGLSYDRALAQYEAALAQYKNLSRSSATSSIDSLITTTQTMTKSVAVMLQNLQNTITFVASAQPNYYADEAAAAAANVIAWSDQINSNLSSLISSQNSITSSSNSLDTLARGAEDLDVRSQRLSLQKAEEEYQKYFIRAPFDGIVGRIPVSVYSQASGSTVIATIVGDRKVANISLNEVDAAKVKPGQRVEIGFDAIDGLEAIGTVGQVDLVGSVSQGVVSYGVKIIISTADDRIKPGMSLNVSIITNEISDALVVPSSAVKTQGTRKYVEVFPSSVLSEIARESTEASGRSMATTTNRGMMLPGTISSSTRQFDGTPMTGRSMTITSATPPTQVTVTIGESDDTGIEILSGLEIGQLVVTRTIAAGSASTATTPNILSSIGGNRGGAAGGNTRMITR
ncbi:MAG: HlyD family efflux transporter periplasmic adaptor subunit [Patescibacteria group bacterium]